MTRRLLAPVIGCVITVGVSSSASTRPNEPDHQDRAPTPAAVSGTVVDGSSLRPIGGAIVTLAWQGADGHGSAIRELADLAGRFVFVGLPPAERIVVRARKAGYLDGTYGQRRVDDQAQPFVLEAGAWRADVQVPVWRGGAVEGRVFDEAGGALVGARVQSFAVARVAGRMRWISGPASITDDLGMYRVGDLPAGRYVIAVESVQISVPASMIAEPPLLGRAHPDGVSNLEIARGTRLLVQEGALPPVWVGGRPLVYPQTFFPSGHSPDQAIAIDLAAGAERQGEDIQVSAVPAANVAGIVDGPPGSWAGVSLRLLAPSPAGIDTGIDVALSAVDAAGRFTFAGVPQGHYILEATAGSAALQSNGGRGVIDPPTLPAPGFQATSQFRVGVGPPGTAVQTRTTAQGRTYWGRLALDVGDADRSGVVFPLHAASRLSGSVIVDAGAGHGAAGPPSVAAAIGVLVRAEPADADLDWGVPSARVAAGGGTFVLDGLVPGNYVLGVSGARLIESVEWQGVDYSRTPIPVRDGQDVEGVVVTLSDRPASVSGSVLVTNGSGAPADALVVCYPADSQEWSHYGLDPARIREVRVAPDGSYVSGPLPAGEYFVAAVSGDDAGRWQDPAFLEAASQTATRLSLAWGEHANLVIRSGLFK